MKTSELKLKLASFPNDNWTRVEIFLRAYGRLLEKPTDKITKKTLDLFCKNWETGEFKTAKGELEKIYYAIKRGEVNITK